MGRKIDRIVAIGEIYNAGFEIIDRHENTVEPMLMGGDEYISRRGSYLLSYNLTDKCICLQKTGENLINYDEPFIIKWMSFHDFPEGLLSLAISMKIGSDYYNCT